MLLNLEHIISVRRACMKSMMDSCVQVYWRRITREHFPSGYLGGKITCRISFCRRVIYSIRILLLYLSIHIQYSTIWSLLPVGITTAVPFKSDPHAETRPRLSVAALRSPPTSMTPCLTTLDRLSTGMEPPSAAWGALEIAKHLS